MTPGVQEVFEDYASLEEWFEENETCFIIPYIEQNFKQVSWTYQYSFMRKNLYFSKKIIEDFALSNENKIKRILDMFSYGKSKIMTVIGGRGGGKTAFVMYLIEQLYKKNNHRQIYYVKKGDRPIWLPEWINTAQSMEDVPNKSFAILDETVLEYGSRNFYKDENKSFTERLVILRHKDISIVLITQHSKLIDINIRRLSDIFVYKMGADVEEAIKDEQRQLILNRLMPKNKETALIEISQTNSFFQIRTGLAEFWDDELVSKTYRDYNPEQHKREQRTKAYHQGLEQLREKERIRAEELKKAGIKQIKHVDMEQQVT